MNAVTVTETPLFDVEPFIDWGVIAERAERLEALEEAVVEAEGRAVSVLMDGHEFPGPALRALREAEEALARGRGEAVRPSAACLLRRWRASAVRRRTRWAVSLAPPRTRLR